MPSKNLLLLSVVVSVMLFFVGQSFASFAQGVILEGYVFESDNRGFLNEVKITVSPKDDPANSLELYTNTAGFFNVQLPASSTFNLTAEKALFHPTSQDVSTFDNKDGDKIFVKVELNRKPGYLFDVTLAEERVHVDSATSAIEGALIEIYNNTSGEEALVLTDYPHPNFSFTFQQGNHYTVLIRKPGYFSKKLEAKINVHGCILCFEGLASIESITDNLTEGHQMGSILANIEMKRADLGRIFKVENILYDVDKSSIRKDASLELDKLAGIFLDNPGIEVELGSHTDSRGEAAYNVELSQRRAEAAVEYLVKKGVDPANIVARGYGETKLINGCSDGVLCSEGEHQDNRRTEIKVVGTAKEEEVLNRSLVDMKDEEKFEKMLTELSNQEVVEVGPGDEIPAEIRSQIEREDRLHLSILKQEPDMQSTVLETTDDQPETPEDEVSQGSDEARNLGRESGLVKQKQKPIDRTSTGDEQAILENKIAGVLAEQPPEINALAMPKDYSGFKIQIIVAKHPMRQRNLKIDISEGIWMEKNKHGQYSYLVGTFREIQEALGYFDEKIASTYPNAKIIEFISGSRL